MGCGYKKRLAFHHVWEKLKVNTVPRLFGRKSFAAKRRLVEEVRKCVLLCSRCHEEHHILKPILQFVDRSEKSVWIVCQDRWVDVLPMLKQQGFSACLNLTNQI
jgi:hypothetical protein